METMYLPDRFFMTTFVDQLKQFWQSLFGTPTPPPATPQQKLTDAIVTASLAAQRQTGPDMRQIHAKSHGLVWAELIVEPNLPTDLQAGLFSEAKTGLGATVQWRCAGKARAIEGRSGT
jgi:hypothetical protein